MKASSSGQPDDSFKPDNKMTMAQYMAVLYLSLSTRMGELLRAWAWEKLSQGNGQLDSQETPSHATQKLAKDT
ncbi:hypothetical protein PAT3040_05442 [Paenibacillus agaridevorans]|uniref:Uncharacterized protein n=1 Tax=Paenibacillus agaridevorans TaxID=171404 RepID=A0A2R5EVJ0_9BACL|nr:hypothetical protein PAT3040_05442 [Paenibacillus agaridevorans]